MADQTIRRYYFLYYRKFHADACPSVHLLASCDACDFCDCLYDPRPVCNWNGDG
uniref:Uncharacterized protein n=1 Tax=Rhizophora mucronata TaxID=61149 RepID=A0A2P2JD38_RHIMU